MKRRRFLTLRTGGLLLMTMAAALFVYGFYILPSHP
jgi:hypothetical protein